MDCSIALTNVASTPSNPSFAYNSAGTESVGDMNTFFVNADSTNCAITSCTVFLADCSSAYTSGLISMASSSPFAMTANRNEVGGYTETVCVSCTNGADT